MAKSKNLKIYHQNIIKPIDRIESSESDCISDDEHNYHINESLQATSICPSHNIYCNENNIYQNSIPISSQSVNIPRKFQNINRASFRSKSPTAYHSTQEQLTTVGSRRSRSFEHISSATLIEKDSGTGESLGHIPIAISTKPIHYEIVSIFGQKDKTALIANRYDFDQTKIDEYRNRKRKNILKPPFNPTTKPASKNLRNTHDSLPIKKSNTLVSFIRKTLKPPSINPIISEPIYRHHTSHNQIHDNH